jgi:hypothetical protein
MRSSEDPSLFKSPAVATATPVEEPETVIIKTIMKNEKSEIHHLLGKPVKIWPLNGKSERSIELNPTDP